MAQMIEFKEISVGPQYLTACIHIGDGYPVMTDEDLEATTRIWRLMPQIANHVCVGDGGKTFRDVMGATDVAHLLEHVTVELMARTNLGPDISYGRTRADDSAQRTYIVQLDCPDDVLCVGALSSAAWTLQWAFDGGGEPEPDIEAIVSGLLALVQRVDQDDQGNTPEHPENGQLQESEEPAPNPEDSDTISFDQAKD